MLYTILCKLTSYTLASTQCTIQHLTCLQAKVLHLTSCHLPVTATKTIMASRLTNSLHQLPSSEKQQKKCSTKVAALISTSIMATQMFPTTNIINKTKTTMSHDPIASSANIPSLLINKYV